jgi:hypothetical protein
VVTVSRHVALGDRGRVPFALVGVLLVASSGLFAAEFDLNPGPPEPAVDLTMERTAADTRSALRGAAASAAVTAASEPVVTPADTPYGRVIADGDAFENALEARIYRVARERFEAVEQSHRGVTGRVSLPQPETPAEFSAAVDRVSVASAGSNGEKLRVTVRNVTQTAIHEGDAVGRRTLTVSVVVDSPVLAAHERVATFQSRLNAGMTKPGLTQKLTARLYPVAWARGYAQYGGAPIANVVSNQHVSLLTNGAVLGIQRSVFGRSDPDGRRAHRKAVGRTALSSVVGQAPESVSPLGTLLEERLGPTPPSEHRGIADLGSEADAPAPNDSTQVRVGETAVEAFTPFTCRPEETPGRRAASVGECEIDGVMRNVLNFTIDRVYSARIRTLSATEDTGRGTPARPGRPDVPGEWELEDTGTRSSAVSVEPATTDLEVSVPDGYHVLFSYERRVTVRYSHVAVWDDENRTFDRLTYNNATGSKLVRVAVVGHHAPTEHAPDSSVETVHDPAPGAGDNLADVRNRVNETVVADRGGPGGMAQAAALDRLDTGAETVSGDPPANLGEQFYPELVALREEIRAIDVTVRKGEVGTYEVNPAALLAETVERRRGELVGAPGEYETVAEKAKYELRAMYVDRVIGELEERARRHRDHESGFATAISEAGGVSLGTVRDSTAARRVDGDDERAVRYRVDGAPPYLTMAEVTHEDVAAVDEGESVYPLKAENINVFTIPHGDASDGAVEWVSGLLSGDSRTRLRTGAQAAGSADSAADATGNASVAAAQTTLSEAVNTSLRTVKRQVRQTLRSEGIAETSAQRRAIVDRAFTRWDGPRREALAVSNGTVVDAVVAEAATAEETDLSGMERDILRIRLQNAVTATLDSRRGTVSGPLVTTATSEVKSAVGNYTEEKLSEQVAHRYNASVSSMPAGLPIAPVPGYWAVTANVWVVNVRGEYERFAVETPRQTPTPGDASLSYVRDGTNVTVDVDGDGTEELLGRSDRVGFDVTTAVVVVVPAGGTGVGDVDGNLQERSAGWERVVDASGANETGTGDDGTGARGDGDVPATRPASDRLPGPARPVVSTGE